MQEEVQLNLEVAQEKMEKALGHLNTELGKVRAGKASTHILDGIQVDYYGTNTALNQVANINTPDSKTIAIQPWEKNMIDPIEKAIMHANIGITPINNGEIIRLVFPPLTEERRRDLTKQVKSMGEEAKVSVRNARRDANEEIKKMQKDGLSEDLAKDAEVEVQELTDEFAKKIDNLVEVKEKDIMTI